MKVRTMTLAGVALVAVVALGVLGTWRWAQATGPDVNNDGTVNIIDIGHVVQSFMQQVPLPHKLYVLTEDLVLSPGETFTSEYVDTRGCKGASSGPGVLLERWSPGGSVGADVGAIQIFHSMDGLVDDEISTNGFFNFTLEDRVRHGAETARPFTKIRQTNETGVQQSLTVFLYCTG